MKRKELDEPCVLVEEPDLGHEPKVKQLKTAAASDQPAPPVMEEGDEVVPTTNKSEKYDRQIRLWGVDGQHDLENANICLLNVTAVGTEILKCLVLPGIGRFTIVDNNLVTTTDLGSNFFLDPDSVGKPKAESACELIQELNPDTVGSYKVEDPIHLLETDPAAFADFTVVVCSRLSERDLLRLGEVRSDASIPDCVQAKPTLSWRFWQTKL